MKKLILVILICFVLSGCASIKSTKRLQKISLDMSKKEIIKQMGNPTVVRGAIRNKYNQVVEVWEYKLDKGKTGKQSAAEWTATLCSFGLGAPLLMSDGELQDYWLYFYNDQLVQWGQAGDWKKEADRIYDFNFNTEQQITQ